MNFASCSFRFRRLFLVFGILLLGSNVWAHVSLRFKISGIRVVHDLSKFPLVYQVHDRSAAGTSNLSQGSDAMLAFKSALAAWQDIPSATIRFAQLSTTSVDSAAMDNLNLITMADTTANNIVFGGRSDIVALTLTSFDALSGKIIDTDIIFNSKVKFSTNLSQGTIDLQSVATHEVGHSLGADHSSASNDTMFWTTGSGDFFQRNLSADSMEFAIATYPNAHRADLTGSITGRVTQGGSGIFGASVTAMEIDRNLIYTALTETDGTYRIIGPIAGRYVLFAEPLDGPAGSVNIQSFGDDSYYKGINDSFRTVFLETQSFQEPNAGNISPLRSNVNFTIPGGAATLNINRMGRGEVSTGTLTLGTGATIVNPGEENLYLAVAGPGASKVASVNDVEILGTGITIDTSRGVSVFSGGIAVVIRVAPDAQPGARTVTIRVGNEKVACTGGIVVAGKTLPLRTLYFPYLTKKADQYTGIALANPTSTPATLRVTARDLQGQLIWDQDSIVPSELTVARNSQVAKLESEIFNLPANSVQTGSITIETDNPDLQSIFLTGDLNFTYLDGAEAFTRGYKKLIFTDIIQNPDTVSEIHLMNVKDSSVTAQLALVDAAGSILKSATRIIPARGKIGESVSSIFSWNDDIRSGHVTATVGDEAITGHLFIRQQGAVFGLNAQPDESAAESLYSAQLAVGNFGVNFLTRFNILNARTTPAAVTLIVQDEAGETKVSTDPIPIPGNGQLSIDARTFFNLLGTVQGSLRIVGTAGAKLMGNVIFGDGDPTLARLNFGAALPLATSGASSFVFSQVATDSGYYTGVALLAIEPTSVTVQVYRKDGILGDAQTFSLGAGERLVRVLGTDDFLPGAKNQHGGFLKIKATKPVVGFELFGSLSGNFLAAVPPQPLGSN